MSTENSFKVPRQNTDPDDRRTYDAGGVIGVMTGFLRVGWGQIANFRQSIRVGSGAATLAALDGLDGLVLSDGTLSGYIARDRTASTAWVGWYETGGELRWTSTAATDFIKQSATTGIITQTALTTLTAGTSITLGASGFTTQGSRIVLPTGQIYAQVNLTSTGAIAVGATIATLASGHRPPGTIAVTLVKYALGASSSASVIPAIINSSGQIQTLASLANTDTVMATLTFMTS